MALLWGKGTISVWGPGAQPRKHSLQRTVVEMPFSALVGGWGLEWQSPEVGARLLPIILTLPESSAIVGVCARALQKDEKMWTLPSIVGSILGGEKHRLWGQTWRGIFQNLFTFWLPFSLSIKRIIAIPSGQGCCRLKLDDMPKGIP